MMSSIYCTCCWPICLPHNTLCHPRTRDVRDATATAMHEVASGTWNSAVESRGSEPTLEIPNLSFVNARRQGHDCNRHKLARSRTCHSSTRDVRDKTRTAEGLAISSKWDSAVGARRPSPALEFQNLPPTVRTCHF